MYTTSNGIAPSKSTDECTTNIIVVDDLIEVADIDSLFRSEG